MMKKKKWSLILAVIILSLLLFSACGGSDENVDGNVASEEVAVDVDLAALSPLIRFAEIENISMRPEDYLGKTIKVSGQYMSFHSGETGNYYHFVIIMDEGGCCSQGFQFRVGEEFESPESFIEEMEEIELVGVYQSIEEGERVVYYLAIKELSVL